MRDFQLFMKRLRKAVGDGVRFYHCGEYGERFGRPHYHACIFGYGFPDKVLWKRGGNGDDLFRSALLERLWTYGLSSIGNVTFESAAYVARYIMKKVTGDVADRHYEWIDEDGVVWQRMPEYTTMSRRPGIGRGWLSKWTDDVYPSDFIVMNGKKCRPPRAYDKVYELAEPKAMRALLRARKMAAAVHAENNTPARLRVREIVQSAKAKRLIREL